MIVRRFDELGLDTKKLQASVPLIILRALRNIAANKMLPEVFIMLDGRIQEHVGRLPIEEQARLVKGELVTVVLPSGKAESTHVDKLTENMAKTVFAGGRINSPSEQRKAISLQGKPKVENKRESRTREPELITKPDNSGLGFETLESEISFYCSRLAALVSRSESKITTEIVESLREMIQSVSSVVKRSGRKI